MIQLTNERLQEVLSYMEDDLPNCLYLYGDIVCYGLKDPNVTVWYEEDVKGINVVIMQYFSAAHVYSKEDNFDTESVVKKLREINVTRISSKKSIVEMLLPQLEDKYGAEYGGVFKLTNYREIKSPVKIEKAGVEDAEAIAELLVTNEVYSHSYRKDELQKEIADRIERKVGRSYIIRDNERIVGHDGVSLETAQFAIEGLALVHDDFRNTLYGAFLDSYMVNDLGKEGKDLYCMIVEGRRMDGFIRMGNEVKAHYGKLFLKDI